MPTPGERVLRCMETALVLDALEQALHTRRPFEGGSLVHHSDHGGQYVSIKYTEHLAETGIERSVGSAGDSYDNALAETVIGLFKTEVIRRRGPWRSLEAVEFATSNESTGSTTAVCPSRSETYRPLRPRLDIMRGWRRPPKQRGDSSETASGKTRRSSSCRLNSTLWDRCLAMASIL